MKAIIQRVKSASVRVAGETVGAIGKGALLFLAIEKSDGQEQLQIMVKKVQQLRMFSSPEGRMDLAAFEVDGEFLVVSQFTLAADLSKGRRPSFDNAALPDIAERMYNEFVAELAKGPCRVCTGKFRAMMDVELVNDGPVTFIIEV